MTGEDLAGPTPPPEQSRLRGARPVIGVCAAFERARWGFWDMPAAIVAGTYLEHLEHGEAVPLALIPSEHTVSAAASLVERIDGLLLLGGVDVSPESYGADPEPGLEATMPLRDRSEIALARAAIAAGVPVLGICRGLHVLNVATGGTLRQDIGELGPARHRAAPGRLDEPTHHGISVLPDSQLACAVGAGRTVVNSHHHQAVDRIGEGAVVTAVSDEDGLVEALEWGECAFAVGVQWHPEAMALGGIIERFLDAVRLRLALPAGGDLPDFSNVSEKGHSHAEASR